MFKKEVILSNFVKKNKILSYLEYIHNVYKIPYYNLFVYEIEKNNEEYVVTFKIDTNKREIVSEIKGATILHYKKGCLFSINALNKLISKLSPTQQDNKDFEINWEEYTDKLITQISDEIKINTIKKIEDKSIFFK